MKRKRILGLIGLSVLLGIGTIGVIATESQKEEVKTDNVKEIVKETDFRIRELRENGILIGDEKGNLNLEKTLKRQEMVVLISRLMGKEEEAKNWNTEGLTFNDVEKENWAAGYIAWAKDNNITKGYSEEWFGYNDTLTEEQTGVFLLRVLGYKDAEIENASELASEVDIIGYYDELVNKEIKRGKVGIMIYNSLYCNINLEQEKLNERLNLTSVYEGIEREIAIIMSQNGMTYNSMAESNGWKIMYVDLNNKEINKETVEQELSLYAILGSYLDFSHYVLIDIETGNKIEVINYAEYGVIYQIKLNENVLYQYSEE